MLLLSLPRLKLRDFLNFPTSAGRNHATWHEAELVLIFSTVPLKYHKGFTIQNIFPILATKW